MWNITNRVVLIGSTVQRLIGIDDTLNVWKGIFVTYDRSWEERVKWDFHGCIKKRCRMDNSSVYTYSFLILVCSCYKMANTEHSC